MVMRTYSKLCSGAGLPAIELRGHYWPPELEVEGHPGARFWRETPLFKRP